MAKNRVFQGKVITLYPVMCARDPSFIAKPRVVCDDVNKRGFREENVADLFSGQ